MAADWHSQQPKQYLQQTSCISMAIIMLVILPVVQGTATAANASTTHTRKCKERAKTTPKIVLTALSIMSVRLATTSNRRRHRGLNVTATPPTTIRRRTQLCFSGGLPTAFAAGGWWIYSDLPSPCSLLLLVSLMLLHARQPRCLEH